MDIGIPLDVLFSIAGVLLAALAVGIGGWLTLVTQKRAQIALDETKRSMEARSESLASLKSDRQASLDAAVKALAEALVESGADEATVEMGDIKITMTNRSGSRELRVETRDDVENTQPASGDKSPGPMRETRRPD